MTLHAMVDIETLATSHDAAILSIGAVRFDPFGEEIDLTGAFRANIDLQDNLNADRKVDGGAFEFWMQQPDNVRLGLLANKEGLFTALQKLINWYRGGRMTRVWSHGATFDAVILGSAFDAVNLPSPWHWRDVRDTRTLFDLAFKNGRAPEPPPLLRANKHDALADAIRQAWWVQQGLYRLTTGLISAEPVEKYTENHSN